jgi:hypothetical protein
LVYVTTHTKVFFLFHFPFNITWSCLTLFDWMYVFWVLMWVWTRKPSWNSNTWSIKHDCLVHFSIKRLYTWLDIVEITFYHRIFIQANGDLAHNARDLNFVAQMSLYAPHMSQILKDYIWTQLELRHMIKQIYNKHKAIWWAWINARKPMIRDNFLRLQIIAYLDHKHKKGNWHLHWNLEIFIQSWVCAHPNDVFYF